MQPRLAFYWLVLAMVLASCSAGASVPPSPSPSQGAADSTPVSPSPDVTGKGSPSIPRTVAPSAAPSTVGPGATMQPSARQQQQPGNWMVTLVDNLRVRSEPRISDDSIMYEPLLPQGTNFSIVRGPVLASGYSWYLVELAPGLLRDGITQGWVAEGDRDGTQWIKNIPID